MIANNKDDKDNKGERAKAKRAKKEVARDSAGRFVKGHAWAGGGATLGQKRELSNAASTELLRIFLGRLPSLPQTLDRLEEEEPAKYATVLVAMAKFAAPQLVAQQIDMTVDASDSLEALLAKRLKGGGDDEDD